MLKIKIKEIIKQRENGFFFFKIKRSILEISLTITHMIYFRKGSR